MRDPTPEDLARDLAVDLAWLEDVATIEADEWHVNWDLNVSRKALAGWPAAIRRALTAEAILNAPLVALFADGREPTTNERHLLNLLSWREREAAEAKAEAKRLRGIIECCGPT